jgi:TPR repeat protein
MLQSMMTSTASSPYSRILGVLLTLLVAIQAQAASFEEGRAAYLAGDYDKAIGILLPLAKQGNSKAQATVGIMYDYGHGVPQDRLKAIEWYEKAALQGVTAVQHQLGAKYFRGQGVSQDYQEAARWWRMAAESGLVESQYNMGLLHAKGQGVPQDYREAARWYRQAAEQGHGQAQYSLANLYALGQGVRASYQQAAHWYRKAAHQGVPQAQYNLGILLEKGRGVERNLDEAIQWYRLAAERGLELAHQKLARLQHTASPSSSDPVAPVAGEINREAWIRAQNPEHFTLQLATAYSEQAIIELIKGQKEGAYFKREDQGKTFYTAIYGVFESHDRAVRARSALPAALQKSAPWVRKFAAVQKLIVP